MTQRPLDIRDLLGPTRSARGPNRKRASGFGRSNLFFVRRPNKFATVNKARRKRLCEKCCDLAFSGALTADRYATDIRRQADDDERDGAEGVKTAPFEGFSHSLITPHWSRFG